MIQIAVYVLHKYIRFQLEIITMNMIFGTVYFREISVETLVKESPGVVKPLVNH